MGKKQRAIKLNLNRTFEEKTYPCDRNKVKVGKKETVTFEPACVFSEEKSKLRFWKRARHLIVFVDGAKNALKFSEVTDEMMPFWTVKEVTELVNKLVAKARLKFKPMTWGQVILIAILLIIVILMQAYSLSRGRF